jgi:SAM-dependent methyltransferase
VGAGLGTNIPHLLNASVTAWLAMEPDPDFAATIGEKIARHELPASCGVIDGTLDMLEPTDRFDTILYLDVLEHIADDAAELRRAARHLARGGKLIVLAPAHQYLFSPFDTAIGHYRRYSATSLRAIGPPELQLALCRMLDSAGLFASLANRLLLRAAQPTAGQIKFWDTTLVPLSRVIDPLTGFSFGKSVLAVWSNGR